MNQRKMSPHLILSANAAGMARSVGASTAWGLAVFPREELAKTRCLPDTALDEIETALAARGLRLGMTLAQLQNKPGTDGGIVVEGSAEADLDGCCEDCKLSAVAIRRKAKRKNRKKKIEVQAS